MAWVTLHNLLEPDKNFRGTVPDTATVRLTLPEPDDLSALSIRPLLTPTGKALLNRFKDDVGKVVTLKEFIAQYPDFADDIEWTFGRSGFFTHFSDGLMDVREVNKSLKKKKHKPLPVGDNPFNFVHYCRLDLNDWLREQDRKTIKAIAQHVFFGHVYKDEDKTRIAQERAAWIESYAKATVV